MQLASYGAEDLVLMQDPEISFFKKVYKRHTMFSIESCSLQFVTTPDFNRTCTIMINKDGDLVSSMFLEVTLPHDSNLVNSYWTNRIGFNLLQKVELYIGKKLIDRMYGLWCHIWVELSHTFDKKNTINKMVGGFTTETLLSDILNPLTGINNMNLACNVPHKLNIPLLFSFCRHRGLAIPLVAIYNNTDITLKFFFEKIENCIQVGEIPTGGLDQVKLWVDYIYLEREENLNITQRPIEYLIEVTQHLQRNLVATGTKSISLPFTLPSKELMWVVRNISSSGDKFTDFTYDGIKSMIIDVQFKFNSKNVFSTGARTNDYFNIITPYQFHTGNPDTGINALSFSLYPEELEPSGIINFSQIKTANININTYGNGILDIFSISYNILKIQNGEASIVHKF